MTKIKRAHSISKFKSLKPGSTEAPFDSGWNQVLDTITAKKTLPPARREACEVLRLIVLGGECSMTDSRKKDNFLYEPIGSKDQVEQLMRFWLCVDSDNSGRVDIPEFQQYVGKVLPLIIQRLL